MRKLCAKSTGVCAKAMCETDCRSQLHVRIQ
ncbi:hypothetical protein VPHD254_0193 [Vibrio phage D254]